MQQHWFYTVWPFPDGKPGEPVTRGPYTIRGCSNAPDLNAQAFTTAGFYRMGDSVEIVAARARAEPLRSRDVDHIVRCEKGETATKPESFTIRAISTGTKLSTPAGSPQPGFVEDSARIN